MPQASLDQKGGQTPWERRGLIRSPDRNGGPAPLLVNVPSAFCPYARICWIAFFTAFVLVVLPGDDATWAQEQVKPPKAGTSPDVDEIVSIKDQSRLTGKINSANSAGINFSVPGGQPKVMSSQEYEIVHWRGVTNAVELWISANEHLANVDKHIIEFVTLQGDEAQVTAQIRSEHRQAFEILDNIPHFPDRNFISRLPLHNALDAAAIKILLDAKRREQYRVIEELLPVAAEGRQIVIALRSQLRMIQSHISIRRFDDASRDLAKLDEEMDRKIKTLLRQKQSVLGYLQFQQGVRRLAAVANQLTNAKEINSRQLELDTFESDLATLDDLLKQSSNLRDALGVLGTPMIDAVFSELTLCREHVQRLEKYRDLTADLRSAIADLDMLIEQTSTMALVDEAQLLKRLEDGDARLQRVKETLKTAEPADLVRLVTRDLTRFSKQSSERTAALVFHHVDLPRITSGLKSAFQVSTSAAAEKLSTDLKMRGDRLQEFLGKGRLSALEDITECRNTLRLVEPAVDRLKARALELDRDEVRTTFSPLAKRMDDYCRSAVEADSVTLVADLKLLQSRISDITDGYAQRLKAVTRIPDGAERLVQEMRAAVDDATRLINFIALRKELAVIDANPSTREQLQVSHEQLVSVTSRIDDHAAQLPDPLSSLRSAVAAEVMELKNRLHQAAARLKFHSLEQLIIDQISQAEMLLAAGQLSSTGTILYLAKRDANSLVESVRQDEWMAKESIFVDRADELVSLTEPPTEQLDSARQQERAAAGWKPWSDQPNYLNAPTIDLEWLEIESLLSRHKFDETQRSLDQFEARHSALPWPTRVLQKRAELELQRGRDHEREGRLDAAKICYLKTAATQLDHPVVSAALAAIKNVDEQLIQIHSNENRWVPVAATCGFLVILVAAVGVALSRRTPSARLTTATRYLREAQRTRSHRRRETLLREAAYLLASFPPNDPRVIALKDLHPAGHRPLVAKTQRELNVEDVPLPTPAEALDVALESQASAQLVAAHCLQWFKSPDAKCRANKKLNKRAAEWLVRNLEPQPGDFEEDLAWKAEVLTEVDPLLPANTRWAKRYRMLISYQQGEYSEAVQLARGLARQRIPRLEIEEYSRMIMKCYILLSDWKAADKFSLALRKQKLQFVEMEDWSQAIKAGMTL